MAKVLVIKDPASPDVRECLVASGHEVTESTGVPKTLEADVVVCTWWRHLTTGKVPPSIPVVVKVSDPRSFKNPELSGVLQRVAAVVVPTDDDAQTLLWRYRMAAERDVETAVKRVLCPDYIEHLYVIYSLGIGGVERAVLDWLSTLPLDLRETIGIATIQPPAPGRSLPLPAGITYVGNPDLAGFIHRHPAIKTVWIQPLTSLGGLMAAAKEHNVKCYWLVCSMMPYLINQAQGMAGQVEFVSTSTTLDGICATKGLTPYHHLPHFVPGAFPTVTGTVTGHRLGFVGRESHEKNNEFLPLVLAALPEYTLDYFVPKDKRPGLAISTQSHTNTVDLINRLGVGERVRWNFDVTDRDEIYKNIDALLLPSMFEGYSLVAHEALVRGIPVVCSDGLPVGDEGNPGVVTFPLPGTGNDRILKPSIVPAMVEAIKSTTGLDRARIQTAAVEHTEAEWCRNHRPTLEGLLGGTQPVRHLIVLWSTDIGGVERSTLDWLETLPEGIRRTVGIMTVKEPTEGLPLPAGVRHLGQWNPEIDLEGIKTLWFQPQIGIGKPFLERCKSGGVSVRMWVTGSNDALDRDVEAFKGLVTVVTTSEPLQTKWLAKGLDPVLIPRFVPEPHPISSISKEGCVSRLGYVGRMCPDKNAQDLPRVLKVLGKPYTLDYFVPVERAPIPDTAKALVADTKALARSLKVTPRIQWHTDETDREAIYGNLDVLLLPSKHEGYSRVAHEALTHGIPVVATDTLLIHGEGLPGLVPCTLAPDGTLDPEAMATAVKEAVTLDRDTIKAGASGHTRTAWLHRHLAPSVALFTP